MTLEQGMKTYHDQLSMLLPQFEGKWAMIDDVELLVCDSPEEANRIGFERCGKINDFLVVRIESDNPHCLG